MISSTIVDGFRYGLIILGIGWGLLALAVLIRTIVERWRAKRRKNEHRNTGLRKYLEGFNAPLQYYQTPKYSERGLTNLAEKCKLRHTRKGGE